MWENRYKGVYYSFSGCKQIEGGAFSNEWKIVKKFGTFEILYFKRKQWYPFATNDWEIYLYLGRLSSEVAGELLDLKEKNVPKKVSKKHLKIIPIYIVYSLTKIHKIIEFTPNLIKEKTPQVASVVG